MLGALRAAAGLAALALTGLAALAVLAGVGLVDFAGVGLLDFAGVGLVDFAGVGLLDFAKVVLVDLGFTAALGRLARLALFSSGVSALAFFNAINFFCFFAFAFSFFFIEANFLILFSASLAFLSVFFLRSFSSFIFLIFLRVS